MLASGEIVEAIEVRSEDTIYLIKVGSKLPQIIKENKENNLEKEDDLLDLKEDNIDDDITT
jgi:DNA-directed RNA polymerase subunit delta